MSSEARTAALEIIRMSRAGCEADQRCADVFSHFATFADYARHFLTSVRRRRDVQQIGDALFQPVQIKRLGEEILGLHRHRAFGDFARERAHENDRDFFRGGLAAQDFADRQAVEIGQQDVEQDQIRFHLPRLAQGVDAVVGHNQLIAVAGELVLQQLDEIVLVIHN